MRIDKFNIILAVCLSASLTIFCTATIIKADINKDKQVVLLEEKYEELKHKYNYINMSYQDLLIDIYEANPSVIEDVAMETDAWKILKQYNDNFTYLYFELSIPTDDETGEPNPYFLKRDY